jgi:hypothetical protein
MLSWSQPGAGCQCRSHHGVASVIVARDVSGSGRAAVPSPAVGRDRRALDRFQAAAGDMPENTRVICQECDIKAQAKNGYA